eukprot:464187_1
MAKKQFRINECGKKELLELPGIGNKLSNSIMTARSTGFFHSINDFVTRVKGIGDTKKNTILESYDISFEFGYCLYYAEYVSEHDQKSVHPLSCLPDYLMHCHDPDRRQFDALNKLIIQILLTTNVKQQIAKFVTGEVRHCVDGKCNNKISLYSCPVYYESDYDDPNFLIGYNYLASTTLHFPCYDCMKQTCEDLLFALSNQQLPNGFDDAVYHLKLYIESQQIHSQNIELLINDIQSERSVLRQYILKSKPTASEKDEIFKNVCALIEATPITNPTYYTLSIKFTQNTFTTLSIQQRMEFMEYLNHHLYDYDIYMLKDEVHESIELQYVSFDAITLQRCVNDLHNVIHEIESKNYLFPKNIFLHHEDHQDFEKIYKLIQHLLLNIPDAVNKEIAEFATGMIEYCSNDTCEIDIVVLHHDLTIYDDNHCNAHEVGFKRCRSSLSYFCTECMDLAVMLGYHYNPHDLLVMSEYIEPPGVWLVGWSNSCDDCKEYCRALQVTSDIDRCVKCNRVVWIGCKAENCHKIYYCDGYSYCKDKRETKFCKDCIQIHRCKQLTSYWNQNAEDDTDVI